MSEETGGVIRPALGWMVFPIVPALLATVSYGLTNLGGADPRLWDPLLAAFLLGPLFGYAFLAGATLELPDDAPGRGLRGLFSRRAIWVGVGPWSGFLFWGAVYLLLLAVERVRPACGQEPSGGGFPSWGTALLWTVLATTSYGWLPVARAAFRRARRRGLGGRAVRRGLVTAIGFLGSLLGTFWAATSLWRSYFFDPSVVQRVVLIAATAALLSGCGTPTVGEVRRRELFQALLTAWVIGLALAWRWLSRPRRR